MCAEFAELARGGHAMPFRLGLPLLASRVAVVGGDVEGGEGRAVVEVADFGIVSEVADELDFVQVAHGCWFLPGRGCGAGAGLCRSSCAPIPIHVFSPCGGG